MQGSIRFVRNRDGWRLEIEFTREPEGSRGRTPRPRSRARVAARPMPEASPRLPVRSERRDDTVARVSAG